MSPSGASWSLSVRAVTFPIKLAAVVVCKLVVIKKKRAPAVVVTPPLLSHQKLIGQVYYFDRLLIRFRYEGFFWFFFV